MRFLLIDRILEYRKGESAVGSKDVTMSEDFLEDHFPRFPVMPGVLQVEAISQLTSWLIFVSNDFKVKGVLSELGTIKFKDFIKPGDQMVIEVSFKSVDSEAATYKAQVKVKMRAIPPSIRVTGCKSQAFDFLGSLNLKPVIETQAAIMAING